MVQRPGPRVIPLHRATAADLLHRLGLDPGPTTALVPSLPAAAIPVEPVAPLAVPDRWNAAVGCKTSEVALAIINQVVQLEHPAPTDSDARMHTLLMDATAMLAELQPATATEALLAAQMVGAQRLAMRFLRQATVDGQTIDGVDRNIVRATRLMRVFNEQVEAMAKLKGKGGQQRVVVEHVTVAAGGQAIVGQVIPGGRGTGDADGG